MSVNSPTAPHHPGNGWTWTEERTALLVRRWTEGATGEAIRIELGCPSRNAVIGKLHRLGLTSANKNTVRPKPATPRAPRRKRIVNHGAAFEIRDEDRPDPILPVMDSGEDVPIEQRRSILNVDTNECKWPFGDPVESGFFYCGAGIVHGSYCGYHARLAGGTPRPYVRRETAYRPGYR